MIKKYNKSQKVSFMSNPNDEIIPTSTVDEGSVLEQRSEDIVAEDELARKKLSNRNKILGATSALALIAAGTGWYGYTQYENTFTIVPTANATANDANVHAGKENPCKPFMDASLACTTVFKTDPKIPINGLISQSVKSGEKVKKNSPVEIDYSIGVSSVKLPEVRNATVQEINAQLAAAKVTLKQESTMDNSGVGKGRIIALSPKTKIKVGDAIPNGTVVPVVVSSGKLTVPDWTGKTKESVQADAKTSSITVKFTDKESDGPVGIVLAQSAKGVQDETTPILVTLSKAKTVKTIALPNIVGQSEMDAQVNLATAGIQKITIMTANSKDKTKDGKVVTMTPAAGTKVPTTSTVVILVAKYVA